MPYTLSADDEGVFRIDLTHEYVRAAREQRLTYGELKTAARNGLTYSFLPGASLWEPGPRFRKVAACRREGPACESFLKTSRKAALQVQLEREFSAFEAKAATGGFPN
jgi:adenosine deaminase